MKFIEMDPIIPQTIIFGMQKVLQKISRYSKIRNKAHLEIGNK